jgi:hypothetical protein
MSDDTLRRAHQLRALARLHPGVGHATRAELGSVTVQVHLLLELLERTPELSPESRQRLGVPLERAQRALGRLERSLAGYLAGFSPASESDATCDLVRVLADLGPLLAAGLKERRIEWQLEESDRSLRVAAHPDVARDILTITVAALLDGFTAPGTLAARVGRDSAAATVTLEGAASGDPEALRMVEETLENLGGGLRIEAEAARIELEFPLAEV